MKKLGAFFLLPLLFGGLCFAASGPKFDPLPDPVSDNAVASLRIRGELVLFSFMGIGPKKTWDAITKASYSLGTDSGQWSPLQPVPGPAGRIAAVAAGARDSVFVFGGYVMDARGAGMAVPDVGIYQPHHDLWLRGADIPVPVGDSVIGVYRDRYIYLIGGRSNNEIVRNVQVYDTEKNKWSQATPIAGTPVFGHSGSLVGETIVYVDGAQQNPYAKAPKYVASEECWMGKIDRHDLHKIQWTKLQNHPGPAHFRIAAGDSERAQKIYFAGGTDNPYDYNGIGYDGKPSEPSPVTFAFNLRSGQWETINENTPDQTMDHGELLVTYDGLVVIGGMEKGQQVTPRVALLPTRAK
jgi:N-acetylneuraminic acid mutarotase